MIYRVYDLSIEGDIFYIGITYLTLKERLKNHFYSAVTRNTSSIKNEIIRNNFPKIEINEIEEIGLASKNEAVKIESYWIEQFRSWGIKLINLKSGRKKKGWIKQPIDSFFYISEKEKKHQSK